MSYCFWYGHSWMNTTPVNGRVEYTCDKCKRVYYPKGWVD